MNNLGKYDNRHHIFFHEADGVIDIRFLKQGEQVKKQDKQMKKKFLDIYQLSSNQLQIFQSSERLKKHMRRIEQHYGSSTSGYASFTHHQQNITTRLETTSIISQEPASDFEALVRAHTDDYIAQNYSELPVLYAYSAILKQDIFAERYQSSLKNTLIVIVQQGFLTVCSLICVLRDLGIPGENIVLFTKPHTTTATTRSKIGHIQESYPIRHIDTSQLLETYPEQYNKAKIEGLRSTVRAINNRLYDQPGPLLRNILVHDEGGTLVSFEEFIDNWETEWKLDGYMMARSEHTISGVTAQIESSVPGSCVSMASSWLKEDCESFFIAEASFVAIKPTIDSLLATCEQENRPLIIGLIGCGNIGSEFIRLLIDNYASLNVFFNISEKQPDRPKYEAVMAYVDSKTSKYEIYTGVVLHPNTSNTYTRAIFCNSDIVFGCTGNDITKWATEDWIPECLVHDTILCSITSGSREFETLLAHAHKSNEGCLYRKGGLCLRIMNHGRPIIFNGRDHAVDPFKIQIIRAATLGSIMQQLTHFSLSASMTYSINSHDRHMEKKYNDLSRSLTIFDSMHQSIIWHLFCIAQDQLRKHSQEIVAELVVTSRFIDRYSSVSCKDIEEHGSGEKPHRPALFMEHAEPNQYNYITTFDGNHAIHLLEHQDRYRLKLVKHDKNIIQDEDMCRRFCRNNGFHINVFEPKRILEILGDIQRVMSRTPSCHGLLQQSMFSPHMYSLQSKDVAEIVGSGYSFSS